MKLGIKSRYHILLTYRYATPEHIFLSVKQKFLSGVSGLLIVSLFFLASCGSDSSSQKTLFIGGIPDQDFALLEERFGEVADYLEEELGISVAYIPVTSYASLVTAFENGDIHLAWFGALSGIQARNAAPGAAAIVQRSIDSQFQSVFIVNENVEASQLSDLAGLTFTFGSENSTSGHLVPRSALLAGGINPDADFRSGPNYSGSHTITLRLVRDGSFQAGALSKTLWEESLKESGGVDADNMGARLLQETDSFFNYHWVAHPDIDPTFGSQTKEKITSALLSLNENPSWSHILDLFNDPAGGFIPTQNSNYSDIEAVARTLNLLGQ